MNKPFEFIVIKRNYIKITKITKELKLILNAERQ